jgi:hypothetical protein
LNIFPSGLSWHHFLKKNNEGVFNAFLDKVLNRFGAPTKELTNKSMEFQKKIQELREQPLIDHRTIFHDHPKDDDLVEIMV